MQFVYNGQTYEGRQDHVKAIDAIVEKCEIVVPPKKVSPPEQVAPPVETKPKKSAKPKEPAKKK